MLPLPYDAQQYSFMKKLKTVLLVDDDEDDRSFFREALQAADNTIKFQEADNGAQALLLLNEIDAVIPDFIFLDLNMPVMDGTQFLNAIINAKHLCHIPVIIYSTSQKESEQTRNKAAGRSAFYHKARSIRRYPAGHIRGAWKDMVIRRVLHSRSN